jgi:hypothetical protein
MPTKELDDTTAALIGHAMVRWVIDDDPAGIARFVPDLEPGMVDDAKAARLAHTVVDLLQRISIV